MKVVVLDPGHVDGHNRGKGSKGIAPEALNWIETQADKGWGLL